jgi:SAM-dependent methyltransferase
VEDTNVSKVILHKSESNTGQRDPAQTVKDFWAKQTIYPSIWSSHERRLRDINWIIPRLPNNINTLCDIGCGDGKISHLITQFVNIKNIYLVDQSLNYLTTALFRWQNEPKLYPHIEIIQFDLTRIDKPLPESDVTLFLGTKVYIFEDGQIISLLRKIPSKQLIIRTPCTRAMEDETINKYSEELKSEYAANYRTLSNTIKLISDSFIVDEVQRIYPDHLNSKFGTRQFIFNCFSHNFKKR